MNFTDRSFCEQVCFVIASIQCFVGFTITYMEKIPVFPYLFICGYIGAVVLSNREDFRLEVYLRGLKR